MLLTPNSDPEDGNHAFLIGSVLGHALRYDVPAKPVMTKDGNYSNTIEVDFGDRVVRLIVVPDTDE